MKKELKEVLKTCKFKAKRLNSGTWQKEAFNDLLEFCEQKDVRIRYNKFSIIIFLFLS